MIKRGRSLRSIIASGGKGSGRESQVRSKGLGDRKKVMTRGEK